MVEKSRGGNKISNPSRPWHYSSTFINPSPMTESLFNNLGANKDIQSTTPVISSNTERLDDRPYRQKSGRKTPGDRGELDTAKQTNEDFAAEVVERLCRGIGFKSILQAAFADVGLTFEIRAAEPVISDAHAPGVDKGADEKPKWKDRLEADLRSPAEFIRDTYGFKDENGTWHHAGLRQSDLRTDPELYAAYATWKRRHTNEILEFAPPERKPGGRRIEDAQEAIDRRRASGRDTSARHRESKRLRSEPTPN